MQPQEQPIVGFDQTGLTPEILSILTKNGMTVPTPIQAQALPVALKGTDVLGIAQTGTGKTLAFALPIIEKLRVEPGKALVLVPTRELALQVEESIRTVTRFLNPGVRTISLIGGAPIYRQIRDLRANPRIVIATPGRLQDLMNQGAISLRDVTVLVLDEADRMFDMGFAPQIQKIVNSVPNERQTLLFSATMPPEITTLANAYMVNPVRIEVARAGTSATLVHQEVCYVAQSNKSNTLKQVLTDHDGSVLVFSRTKHGATKLSRHLRDMGHEAAEIHSNRSLYQRRQALDGFKSGRYRVLVATDIAARGIDVRNIEVVVNYDLPDAPEDYVHRIGRTGRAGQTGKAISFATHDQLRTVRTIERLINKQLVLSEHSEAPQQSGPAYSSGPSRPRNFSSNRGGGGRARFRTRYGAK